MNPKKPALSRRNFLLTVGAGSAATAAVLVGKGSPSPATASADGDKRATRGYAVSEHVNNYYRTAKV